MKKVQIIKCSNKNLWYKNKKFPINAFVDEASLEGGVKTYNSFFNLNNVNDFYYSKNLMGFIAKEDCIDVKNDLTYPHSYSYIRNELYDKGSRLVKMDLNELKPTKDSVGKLFYELDWEFIQGIAERMVLNKKNGKYDTFGWMKNGVDVDQMNQAIIRHTIEIAKGNYSDEQIYGHYYALACNSMLIVNQLKKIMYESK